MFASKLVGQDFKRILFRHYTTVRMTRWIHYSVMKTIRRDFQCCDSQKVLQVFKAMTSDKILSVCSTCLFKRNFSSSGESRSYLKQLTEVKACTKILLNSGLPTENITFGINLKGPQLAFQRWFAKTNSQPQQHSQDGRQNSEQDSDEKPPQDEEKMPVLARLMFAFWLGFILYVILRSQSMEETGAYKFISWNEFVQDILAKGEVEEIVVRPEAELAFIKLYPGAIIKGRKAGSDVYTLKIADPDKFEEKLRKTEAQLGITERLIPVSYSRESSWLSLVFMGIVAVTIFLVLRNIFSRISIQFNASDMFANERKAKFIRADKLDAEKGISFKDIAGLHEAKVEVMEFVDYLKKPQNYQKLGAKIPKGALLLGPPGCGKTLLAKAVASEASVPFLVMAGSEFVEMIGGLGASRVRDLFKEARKSAPCIIYIDEIDAIGKKRGGNNWSESAEEEHTLNQLLVEMDGMGTKEGVLLLASTNRHEVLDKALLRPGRFDRHIMIDLPTLAERKEIFEIYLKKLRLAQGAATYSETLAQMTPGMSGADIANICNESALFAARENRKVIDSIDFDYAMERVIAGVAKKSRILSSQEKRIVAFHEAGHAVVGWLLQYTDPLLKVSIVPRTNQTLGFAQYTPNDRKLHSKEELFERMCMALGGRVAETITFNSITSGAQDDLQRVTDIAYAQVKQLGMSNTIGHLSFPSKEERNDFMTKPYSKKLARTIDYEASLLVAKAYQATEKLLQDNQEKLRMVAEALLEKETLTYKDMEQLIGPPPYGKKSYVLNDLSAGSSA